MEEVPFYSAADLCIINTCSVTNHADKKCKKIVREAVVANPDVIVVVTGCFAQLRPKEISEIPGVHLVLGNNEKFDIIRYLSEIQKERTIVSCVQYKDLTRFHPAVSIGHRTRSFLKVQDGCDYFCSFCTIPLARGKSRSASPQEVLSAIWELEEKSVREVVLTGINLGEYGKDLGTDLYTLLKEILEKTTIPRIRLSSIEPNLIEDRLIYLAAEGRSRIMPHFHVPLQSGCDPILEKMRRRYNTSFYKKRIFKIKEFLPHSSIGIDILTGFPGESDEYFKATYDFLKSLPFHYLHVFTYSERPRTTALKLSDRVPLSVRKERTTLLKRLSDFKEYEFSQQFLNTTRPVLFENTLSESGEMQGYTDNYLRVQLKYDPNSLNQIIPVSLSSYDPAHHIFNGQVQKTMFINEPEVSFYS